MTMMTSVKAMKINTIITKKTRLYKDISIIISTKMKTVSTMTIMTTATTATTTLKFVTTVTTVTMVTTMTTMTLFRRRSVPQQLLLNLELRLRIQLNLLILSSTSWRGLVGSRRRRMEMGMIPQM